MRGAVTMTSSNCYDLSRYACATAGCQQPAVYVRQTSDPTAFYGECRACHARVEHDLAERAERDHMAQDRRARASALIERQPTWALRNMIRALRILEALNTPEEAERLDLARRELRARRRQG